MARLEDLADDLYALPLAEFTAARNALAARTKPHDAALAAALQALRKPSASAWVVNALVRARRDDVVQLIRLGATMRAAQADLDRTALADLTRQRRQLVQTMTRAASDVAAQHGQKLAPSTLDEVAQTLQAALADEIAGGAVLSGRLVRGLATVGTEVDVTDAVGAPGELAIPAAPQMRPANVADLASHRALVEARTALEASQADVYEAEAQVGDLDAAILEVEERRDELAIELAALQKQAGELGSHIRTLERERRSLDRERERANRVADDRRRLADQAKARLAELAEPSGTP